MSGTKVQIKYGFGKPADGSLKKAELAIDLDDRSLWTADENGVIVRVAHDTTDIEKEIESIIENLEQIEADLDWVNNDKDKQNLIFGWGNDTSHRYSNLVLIGTGVLGGDASVVIGEGTRGGSRSVSLGVNAKSEDEGVSLGANAESFYNGVALGRDTTAEKSGIAVGDNANAGSSGIALGTNADAEDGGIALGNYVEASSGEFAISSDIDAVNFSEATVQATDYLDADGNSIIGNHDGDIANLQGQINTNANNISNNANDISSLEGALNQEISDRQEGDTALQDQINNNAGDISALRDDFDNHDHALDDLSDVSASNPSRDDLLIWNGSSWSASSFDLIETALNFKGSTNVAQAAPAAEQGDLYVNNTQGTAAASWTGIAGKVVNAGNFIGYANSRWYLLGEIADVGVTSVIQGLGTSVDDSKPSEPVVSVDRTETDKWYADKGHNHSGVYEPVITPKNSAFNKDFAGTGSANTVSRSDHTHNYSPIGHDHAGVYEPVISPKNSAFNKNFAGSGSAATVSRSDHTHNYSPIGHDHAGVYEPVISPKNSAFNKSFGTTSGTVAQGNHTHSQYLTDYTETDPTVPGHVKSISQADIDKWNNPPSGGGGTDLPDGSVQGQMLSWNNSSKDWTAASQNVRLFYNGFASFYALGTGGLSSAKMYCNFAIGNAASTTMIGKSRQGWTGTSGDVQDSCFVIGNNNTKTNYPLMFDSITGEFCRFMEKEVLAGGAINKTFYHDNAGNTHVHGGIWGPNNLCGSHGAWQQDTTNTKLMSKANVKSWSKQGTGKGRAVWTTAENFFSGESSSAIASVIGDGFKGTGIPYNPSSDLFVAYSCAQYSTSNSLINGLTSTFVWIANWNKPPTTRIVDGEEVENPEAMAMIQSDEYKRFAERFQEKIANPSEAASPDEPTIWTYPDLKTGQVIVVVPGIMDFDDVLSDYRNGEVITQRTREQLPSLNELYDCWRMDGKDIVVDLDLAKEHAMSVLRHQFRYYYRSVEADQFLFGDDSAKDIKQLAQDAKAMIEEAGKADLDALDDLVGRLRNENNPETFMFQDWA